MNLKDSSLLQTQAFINGDWHRANKQFEVVNPWNGEGIAMVEDAGTELCELAISAASDAFPDWSSTTSEFRSRLLKRWNDLILSSKEDLALLLTAEQGKPYKEAVGEIKYGASYIEWFAEEAKRIYGDTIPARQQNQRILVLKQAVGPVAAITPWNFPNAMIARKVAPALAAGCTVVIKPAEDTPLSALALAKLAQDAGFPKGVINVICSSNPAPIGEMLSTDKRIKKISFTGSTEVGKLLLKQASSTVKKVSMELGGNAPFIVLNDANLDKAVEGLIQSKFRNAGQTCVCANRVFVQDTIMEAFTAKFRDAISKLKVGNGMDENTDIGPLINIQAKESITHLIADAVEHGASVNYGGKSVGDDLCYMPTIITGVRTDMAISKQEIFGPIAALYAFSTDDELIKMANDTNYGLASYFFGENHSRIWKIAEALEYGMVGINTGLISNVAAPFGGIKESGMGREGSKYGIDEYLQMKYICWEI